MGSARGSSFRLELNVPRVSLRITEPRQFPYVWQLESTKNVYDGLLAGKQIKLLRYVLRRKAALDAELERTSETESLEVRLERGVEAQQVVNTMVAEMQARLDQLHADYQHKLNRMHHVLRQEHLRKSTAAVESAPSPYAPAASSTSAARTAVASR